MFIEGEKAPNAIDRIDYSSIYSSVSSYFPLYSDLSGGTLVQGSYYHIT